jgi:hypothetical protein
LSYKQERKEKKLTWGPNDDYRCLGPRGVGSARLLRGWVVGWLEEVVGGAGEVVVVVVEKEGGGREGGAVVVDGGGERKSDALAVTRLGALSYTGANTHI